MSSNFEDNIHLGTLWEEYLWRNILCNSIFLFTIVLQKTEVKSLWRNL